jgi:ferritin-like metal-binding protein YciE
VGAAQAVEHYDYGTLKAWAEELGLEEDVSLLEATLTEEEDTDKKLWDLAEAAINQRAEAAE